MSTFFNFDKVLKFKLEELEKWKNNYYTVIKKTSSSLTTSPLANLSR